MSTDPVVAYRDGVRWIQAYQPMRLALTEPQPERLRHQGVYLITGGLGNVGMALADWRKLCKLAWCWSDALLSPDTRNGRSGWKAMHQMNPPAKNTTVASP